MKLDSEILEVTLEEADVIKEIEEADVYRERIELAIIALEQAVVDIKASHSGSDRSEDRTRHSNVSVDTAQRSISPSDQLVAETSRPTSSSQIERRSTPSRTTSPHDERTHPVNPPVSSPVQSHSEHSGAHGPKVKLPKLSLKKFNGEPTDWITFWDAFESSIHKNSELSDVDRFNYLHSLLEGTAADAISGLSLTSTNYAEAIALLKKRFGNRQQIVNKHMDQLLALDPVTSLRDLKGLRRLYDKIEAHVRSLKGLGISSESYSSMLSSVLMKRLPQELGVIVSRQTGTDPWNFNDLMQMVERELEARERATVASVEPTASSRRADKVSPTISSLLSGNVSSDPVCCYCGQSHASDSCKAVSSYEARRQILLRSGRCFVCLRKGHVGKNCRSTYKCSSCSGRHHSSICVKTFPNTSRTTSSQASPAPNVPMQGNKPQRTSVPTAPVRTPSLSMYVESHTPVLLQTAVTIVCNPRQLSLSAQTRIILDSGSQRSYITQGLREDLGLCPERAERVVIKTFDSTDEKELHCDVVKMLMKTTDGDDLELEFLVVPLICEALSGQVITRALDNYPHLVGLDLAETGTSTNKKVGVLIGSDHYWKVVSGEIVRGSTGPTALKSRFGWILSGPLSGLMECSTISNLACCQTLFTTSDPLQRSDTELEIALRRFWDLESLGIQGEEPTLYEKFVNSIAFINNRYQVRLPWGRNITLLYPATIN